MDDRGFRVSSNAKRAESARKINAALAAIVCEVSSHSTDKQVMRNLAHVVNDVQTIAKTLGLVESI